MNKLLLPWLNLLIEGVRSEEVDLSARQMTIFLTIYLLVDEEHTVRSLSKLLQISKPAISRAVNYLVSNEYIRKKPDEEDARSFFINKTIKGKILIEKMEYLISEELNIVKN